MTFPYFYNSQLTVLWGKNGSPLFRQRFRVLARGALNSRMVEFEDGTIHIINGNSIRKVKL